MPSDRVDLLLGPLVTWVTRQPDASPAAVAMAEKIAGRERSVHFWVVLRMCALWDLYCLHTRQIPEKFTFPYYMGVVMDLHIEAIRLGPEATLQLIYSRRKAPENVRLETLEHDEHSRIDPGSLERHWVSYACHVAAAGQPAEIPKVKTRSRKRQHQKGITNTLIVPQIQARGPALRQDPKSLTELLTKGQPNQTVVRYVLKAFIKGLQKSPATNPVIVTMTRMFFLGSYRHSSVIAAPEFRIAVYAKHTPASLYDLLEKSQYNAKQLYFILAEFIVASTVHNHALESMLQRNPAHAAYERTARYNGNEMRTKHHPKIRMLIKPPKNPATPRYPTNVRLFWELVRHLDIKSKPPPRKVASATAGIGIGPFFEVVRRQPNTLQIFRCILVDIGMGAADLEIMEQLMRENNDRISKGLKKMLAQLSDSGRDRLYLYVFFITRRLMLAYVPLGSRSEPQHGVDTTMAVCNNCFMIRTPCLMEQPYKKAKSKGVEIDIENGVLRCAGCKSDRIDQVNMRRNYVYGPAMSDPSQSRMYCACYRCGIMTVYRHVVGTAELCESCYSDDMLHLLVVRQCICGRIIDDKSPHKTITALNSQGKVALYGLCKDHFFVKNVCRESDIQPIAFYRTFIAGTTRKRRRDK